MHSSPKTILLLLLCGLGGFVKAQHFSNLYYDNRPSMLFGSIEFKNDNYYATGVTTFEITPNHYYSKAVFSKINGDGVLNFEEGIFDTINHHYSIFCNCLKRTLDGNFIATGELIDSISMAFLIKTDTAGNILLWKVFKDSSTVLYQGMDVIETPDSGYLLLINAAFNSNNQKAYLARTDALGNILNDNFYNFGGVNIPWRVNLMLNGHYMLGGVSQKNNGNTPFWAKTWLLEVDSMGNYINQWLDTDNKSLWPRGMQQTADSGWIIARDHVAYDISDVQGYIGSLLKLDKTFHKEWEVQLGDTGADTGFSDVEILPDGKYIVCGATPTWGHDSAYQWGWILKIDTDGTILWDKKYIPYERFGTYGFLYDIDVLPNGDFLACGELRFTFDVGITPVQQGWILRTDSNGCEIENCLTGISQSAIDNPKFAIFPNPAHSYFSLDIENPLLQGGSLDLYNIDGKKLCTTANNFNRQTKVDISQLPNGIYLWRYTAPNQVVQSGKVIKE